MFFIALTRLWNRLGLTLLSLTGMTLAIGTAVCVPIFAKAASYAMLQEELHGLDPASSHALPSVLIRVFPRGSYPLSLEQVQALEDELAGAIASESGLDLIAKHRQMETVGLIVRTSPEHIGAIPPNTTVFQDTRLAVLPDVGSRLTVVDGEPMLPKPPVGDVLEVWINYAVAKEAGLYPREKYVLHELRNKIAIPIRIAGAWIPADPSDTFWLHEPDQGFRRALLVRESDYRAIVEPAFESELRSASWHLVLDHSQLTSENMRDHAEGLRAGIRIASETLPEIEIDSPLLAALDTALKREADLTVLMFVFSVPLVGFLLCFLSLVSAMTVRWQGRETAIMVSRGMDSKQLLAVSLVEAGVIAACGLPLGIWTGVQLARAMGYTESFLRFTWRTPLPISGRAVNGPLLVAACSASLVARLWPVLRSSRASVVSYEQRRSRNPGRPFWQRFYLDALLLVPTVYAYRRLRAEGTLVPQAVVGDGNTTGDPLLFLVPALFTLALSLLLVRLFPLFMRLGEWFSALGRQTATYLAFRQLARQSSEYTSALLLVITSLSLGGFMASMAASLDRWLVDQVCYATGADVLIKQTYNPAFLAQGIIPSDGAWMLPIQSYLDLPGVAYAARVGMYRATVQISSYQSVRATFLGVDRVDLPRVLFFRRDFAAESLGSLMNQLALRPDAALLSEGLMVAGRYEVGDRVPVHVVVVDLFDHHISLETDFTIAGAYKYFPTIYEQSDDLTAVIGNLDYLFERIGGAELHDIWLTIEPGTSREELVRGVEGMNVYVKRWTEAREEIAKEEAKPEHVGIFGTLTIGFLGAAAFSGIGLLIYHYASLQERLFRFTILRALGLSLLQVVGQVVIEYSVLMVYSVTGGIALGAWASKLFIPFFQATDKSVLRPPTMIAIVAWEDSVRISSAFVLALLVAQAIVIGAALRKGVFQALRIGDQE